MIQQTLYTSRATGERPDTVMPEILRCARRNNPELDITGLLIVSGDTFIQFIEGNPAFLEPLLDLIRTDRRHTDMTRLFSHPARLRAFPDWSMAFCDLDARPGEAPAVLDQLERLSQDGSDAAIAQMVAMMQTLGTESAAAA